MQQYYAKEKKDNLLILNNDDLNHIKNVMRMKENDKVIVVYDSTSYICALNKDLLSCNIESIFKEYEDNTNFIIYMPLLSDEKMSEIFKHGTELGITKYIVVNYNHCKYKLKKCDYEKKLNRWNKIVKEASEQSYRIYKPVVEGIIDVKDICDNSDIKIVCSLDKNNVKHISSILTSKNVNDTISISFGPEGGLNEIEEDLLVSKGFIKTSLCNNVLRTETVPLFLASIRSYLKDGK